MPFFGVVLAGVFTAGSLEQLDSLGFKVVYIHYNTIITVYAANGISIDFDENTPDAWFSETHRKIIAAGKAFEERVIADLRLVHREQFDDFFSKLKHKLMRHIDLTVIIPLFGKEYQFTSVSDVIEFMRQHTPANTDSTFLTYEIIVRYSNGDKLEAAFSNKDDIEKFLRYAAS